MPYVALAPATRLVRSANAQARWHRLSIAHTELHPAIALQRALLAEVSALSDRTVPPRLSLPPKYLAAKLLRGIPALTGEPIPPPSTVVGASLTRLCDALAHGGAGEAATRVRAQLDETRLPAARLLTAVLRRDSQAVKTLSTALNLQHELVWLVGELAMGPFVHALLDALFAGASDDSPLGTALRGWEQGYCPFCASWAAYAEASGDSCGARTLRCEFCAAAWTLTKGGCVFCGESGEKFVAAPADAGGRRLDLCGRCRGYFKTITVDVLTPFPLLPIAVLETMDLDMAAIQRGFGRAAQKVIARR